VAALASSPRRGQEQAMYAIIQTGGKQYRVRQGQVLLVERLGPTEGPHTFEDVLLVSDGGDGVRVGAPRVSGAAVAATVLGEQKGKKVLIFKKKRRKGYKRKTGHRQIYARVRIDGITG
jgi:large subunit ribosomal protein L21